MQIPVELFLTSLAAIATGVVGAGIRKVWVWGWNLTDLAQQYETAIAYRDERLKEVGADRDRWRDIAMRQAGITEVAVKVLEKKANGG